MSWTTVIVVTVFLICITICFCAYLDFRSEQKKRKIESEDNYRKWKINIIKENPNILKSIDFNRM